MIQTSPPTLWAFSLCHLHLIAELVALNVALKNNVSDCLDRPLSNTMVDGIKDPEKFESAPSLCRGRNSYVEILLSGTFAIHYVIVFPGNGPNQKQLDYFMVRVYQGPFLAMCGDYPGTAVISDAGMRVNCMPTDLLHDTVLISSRRKEGLDISEIEVHSLASTDPDVRPMHYRGCFRVFGTIPRVPDEPYIYGCIADCARSGYLFSGVMNNQYCYCDAIYDEKQEVALHHCDVTCTDGKGICGGIGYISVYLGLIRLPIYTGCYKMVDVPDQTLIKGKMGITKCIRHCDSHSFAVLEGGDNCFCINRTLKSDKMIYDGCNKACSGTPSEFCGGIGYISVYETCLRRSQDSIKCSQMLNCANAFDKFGDCLGPCKPGFRGENCLERSMHFVDMSVQKQIPKRKFMDHSVVVLLLQILLMFSIFGVIFLLIQKRALQKIIESCDCLKSRK